MHWSEEYNEGAHSEPSRPCIQMTVPLRRNTIYPVCRCRVARCSGLTRVLWRYPDHSGFHPNCELIDNVWNRGIYH